MRIGQLLAQDFAVMAKQKSLLVLNVAPPNEATQVAQNYGVIFHKFAT
jgi:hypothetical protein